MPLPPSIVSLPRLPVTLSSPDPASTLSLPGPRLTESLPGPATTESAPRPAKIQSLPAPLSMVVLSVAGQDDVVAHLAVPDEAGRVSEGDLVELHPQLRRRLDQTPHGLLSLQQRRGRGRGLLKVGRGQQGTHVVIIAVIAHISERRSNSNY